MLFSEIVIFRTNCAVVRFCNHSYDDRPSWAPISSITITYREANNLTHSGNSFLAMLFIALMNPRRICPKLRLIDQSSLIMECMRRDNLIKNMYCSHQFYSY